MIDLRDPGVTAAQVIAALGLAPHPEGGHYREIW
ncbi:MAG: cupin domain-containing protein, partial [Alphaproteobacteria bacterium]